MVGRSGGVVVGEVGGCGRERWVWCVSSEVVRCGSEVVRCGSEVGRCVVARWVGVVGR